MRKKTAPRTRQHQAALPPQQSGLIAREKNAPPSATTRSALDKRSHRTHCVSAAGDSTVATQMNLFLDHPARQLQTPS